MKLHTTCFIQVTYHISVQNEVVYEDLTTAKQQFDTFTVSL